MRYDASLISMVIGLCLVGCVHIQQHPKSWDPPLNESGQGVCIAISGTYENIGVDPKGGTVNLAQYKAGRLKR